MIYIAEVSKDVPHSREIAFSSELCKQIDTASNALVAFAVLHGLTYCYTFGTNEFFNCLVKTAEGLAWGLIISFIVGTTVMAIAIWILGRKIVEIATSHSQILKTIYNGKVIAVVLAAVMPIGMTYWYGVHQHRPDVDCHRLSHPTASASVELLLDLFAVAAPSRLA